MNNHLSLDEQARELAKKWLRDNACIRSDETGGLFLQVSQFLDILGWCGSELKAIEVMLPIARKYLEQESTKNTVVTLEL